MKIQKKELIKSLNKTFRKEQVNRTDFDNFKSELLLLLSKVNENESEEHLKYPLRDFFIRTSFSENEINTKGRTDLAIYSGNTTQKPINVIFEIKKPQSNEFLTNENINCKALQECVLYYIKERTEEKNDEIKHIIITNVYEWYIFDALDFEKYFFVETHGRASLRNEYEKWKAGQKTSKSTEHFYKIVEQYINNSENEIPVTYFDLRNYTATIDENEKKLVPLFKILSATHLLKQSFATDSNSLNTPFYNELLYILGLEEVKEGTKKIIKRTNEKERRAGSFIENAIDTLKTENRLLNKGLQPLDKYGKDENEQLFTIALELSIAWINRILFLKLLEAQLIRFHKNESYKFLDFSIITNFSELNELFFDILNKQINERTEYIKPELKNIPYLNSSLFEISKLENDAIRINSLKDRLTLPTFSQTVLKDQNGNRLKAEKPTLEYLFDFLNAYNFSNEGADEIQEENKSLINASVLGLIFEKINGYKEGSFFTPGYITMYMSRETIRRAVIQKFKEAGYKNLQGFENLEGLKNQIENREEANRIINSIKIIDPAVGSGHFLVSALNELIAIKSELDILSYKSGRRILDFKTEVVNDDLIITNLETEEIFEYTLNEKGNTIPYKQDLQEAIFHEKQTIIENCLFGTDINSNSVNICRLRLWIELLKHTYYKKLAGSENPQGLELETLPNIDINIKQGNSLISNFGMNGNGNGVQTGHALSQQKIRLATQKYKDHVILYKSTDDKKVKQDAEQKISEIKTMFSEVVRPLDKDYKLLKEKEAQLGQMPMLFIQEDKENWEIKRAEIQAEIDELKKNLDQKNKTIYKNAFEWRFEFPEVLDENGNFEGFDVVMGNPPYISIKEIPENHKKYYKENYKTAKGQFDLYTLFIEKSYSLLKKHGHFSMITSNTYFANKNLQPIRNFLLDNVQIEQLVNLDESIFKEAKLDVGVTFYKKEICEKDYEINIIPDREHFTNKKSYHLPKSNFEKSENKIFTIHITPFEYSLFDKMKENSVSLKEIADINRGIEYGSNSKEIKAKQQKGTLPLIVGHSIGKYRIKEFEGYAKFKKNDKSNYKDFVLYSSPRILVQRIRNLSLKTRLVATYTDETILCTNTLRIITLKNDNFDYKYILALLNSGLINFYFLKNYLNKDIYAYQLGQIPIKIAEKNIQEQISTIVSDIENSNSDTQNIKNQKKIDKIVYKLYGLTKTEIAKIEKFYEQK